MTGAPFAFCGVPLGLGRVQLESVGELGTKTRVTHTTNECRFRDEPMFVVRPASTGGGVVISARLAPAAGGGFVHTKVASERGQFACTGPGGAPVRERTVLGVLVALELMRPVEPDAGGGDALYGDMVAISQLVADARKQPQAAPASAQQPRIAVS